MGADELQAVAALDELPAFQNTIFSRGKRKRDLSIAAADSCI